MATPPTASPALARLVYDPRKHGSLRDAVAAVAPGGTLVLPAGDFAGPIGIDKDLTIEGAGATKTYLAGDRAHALVLLNEGPVRVHLSGLTFREGELSHGGAIQVTSASHLTVEDCSFVACRGMKGGGAIYVTEGTVVVRRALIHKCAARFGGAVMLARDATAELEDVVIEENDSVFGGGIYIRDNAVLTLRDVFVRRNGARHGASALEAQGTIADAPRIDMTGGALAGGSPALSLETAAGAKVGPILRARGALLPRGIRTARGFTDGGENSFA